MRRSRGNASSAVALLVYGVTLFACSSPVDSAAGGVATGDGWIWKEASDVSHITPAYDSARHQVYILSRDRELIALKSNSGEVAWRNKYSSGVPFGVNIAVAGDMVYVGDVDVWAFKAATGQLMWIISRVTGNEGARAIESDGRTIFVSAFDGRVQRLGQTPDAIWTTTLRKGDSTLNAFGNKLVGSTLFVCGVNFASPVQTGTLFALDAATGQERWRYQYTPLLPGQGSKCFSRVAHSGALIFSAQDDGRIFAHDAVTGAVRWSVARIHSPPGDPNGPGTGPYDDRRLLAADADHLVATSDDGSVVCYSTRDGSQLWRTKGPGAAADPPVLAKGMAMVPHVGFTVAYDLATGEKLWEQPSTDPHSLDATRYFTQPVLFGDTLLIAGNAGARARILTRK